MSGERGFTLVELMVAMVIGLILLGGVYTVFFSSVTTYRQTAGLSRLQENGRFALELLGQELRNAGYPRFSVDGTPFADVGVAITGNDGGGTVSDDVTIQYLTTTGLVTSVFTHDADPADQALVLNSVFLIDGVENMQILYGVDTDDDLTLDDFLDADDLVTAGHDWDDVLALRIGLLLATPDEGTVGDDPDTNRYDVDGVIDDFNNDGTLDITDMRPSPADAHYDDVFEFDPPDDRKLRQVFRTTIALRNRMR